MLFQDGLVVATEALDFKVNTKFAQEFTQLMQTVFDYKEKELKDKSLAIKRKALFEFFGDKVFDKMIDLIEKFCGYDLAEIATDTGGRYSFATAFIIFDNDGESINNEQAAGTSLWPKGKKIDSEDLINLAKTYDVMNGNVLPKARKKINDYIQVGLYFDFNLAFLADDISGVKELGLTAREITGIILHEIGHIMIQIEHAADGYARLSVANSTLDYFLANGTEEEKIKFLEKLRAKARKGDVALTDAQKVAIDKVLVDATDIQKSGDNRIIATLIGCVFAPLLYPMLIAAFFRDLNNFTSRGYGSSQEYKYSDLPTNLADHNRAEVRADQYANRHGYGAELVTSLDKMDRLYMAMAYGVGAIVAAKNASTLNRINSFMGSFCELLLSPMLATAENHVYPVGVLRFMELQKDCIAAMKGNSSDAATIKYYMNEYERMRKVVANRAAVNKWGERGRSIGKFISYLVSIPSIYHMIVDGRVGKELNTLITELNNLNNNHLYYYGTKLKELAKK